MRTFLVEPNKRYPLDALEPYGELVYASPRPMNPFDVHNCLTQIRKGLKDFDPMDDYICLTGRVQTVAFFLAAAHEKFGTIRVLMFDAVNSNYRERIVTDESS